MGELPLYRGVTRRSRAIPSAPEAIASAGALSSPLTMRRDVSIGQRLSGRRPSAGGLRILRGRHRCRLSPRRLLGMNATKICSMLSASSRQRALEIVAAVVTICPDRPARDRENHASQPTPRSPAAIANQEALRARAIGFGSTSTPQDAVASEAVPAPPP